MFAPAPIVPPLTWANAPAEYFWIDGGPFKDRLDLYGYPGLKGFVLGAARTNDVCYAALADFTGRQYIDLKGRYTELRAALDGIATVVAAASRPEFSVAMREAVLTAPTTEYERHVKGLPQPEA